MVFKTVCVRVENNSVPDKFYEKDGEFRSIKEVHCRCIETLSDWAEKELEKEVVMDKHGERILCLFYDESLFKNIKLNGVFLLCGKYEEEYFRVVDCRKVVPSDMLEPGSTGNGRREIHRAFSELFGPAETGELVLLSLLSTNTSNLGGLNIGRLQINIVVSGGVESFLELARQFVPSVRRVELSRGSLESGCFVSVLDESGDFFSSGDFSVCDGTCVVIDEKDISEGEIKNVENVTAVRHFMESGEAAYSTGQQLFFVPTDTAVVVFSEKKSILNVDNVLRVSSPGVPSLSLSAVSDCRWYFSQCREFQYRLDKEVSVGIEKDYVEERKRGYTERMFVEDMNVFSLLCKSHLVHGTMELWQHAKKLGRYVRGV
ncbi:MAG: mini-chromosome maintenance complex-binding protein [Amphiamblys sp. WSBS2006]|nr:MAG: mini-chromosome maintenance complex-binding protein [Amphiamblys sp. WSBS2006]